MRNARRWMVRILAVLAVILPVSLAVLYVVNPFGARSADPRERILGHGMYRQAGASMAPTIDTGQIVFVRAGYYRERMPQRGEIVTAISPETPAPIMKRVVGLPGETIAISGGQLLIDGKAVAEPYVSPANASTGYSLDVAPTKIPRGHYYLLGDNRDNSSDSRHWGPVAHADLLGRVVVQ